MMNLRSARALGLMSIVVTGLSLQIAGFTLTLERLVALACVPFLVFSYAAERPTYTSSHRFSGYLIAWVLVLLASTIISNDPLAHASGLVISLTPVVFFFLFARSEQPEALLKRWCEPILWFMAIGALITFALSFGNESLAGVVREGQRARFLSLEPNIFGASLALLLLLHLGHARPNLRHALLHICGLTALYLSFSKAPYAGYLIGLFVFLLCSGSLKKAGSFALIIVTAPLLTAAGLFLSSSLAEIYSRSLHRADALDTRMVIARAAWHRIEASPLIGNGALDFGLRFQDLAKILGSTGDNDAWIWQVFLAVIHDTGFLGFAFYTAFLFSLIGYGVSYANRTRSRQMAACVAGFVAILACSQTTTLHLTAIFGIAAGFIAAGVRNDRQLRPRVAMRREPAT
jgi:hypothetical protein